MSDDRPRLEEIGGIAAEQATATLADLLGRTVHTEAVRERGVASRDLALEFGSPGERVAGVFVDLAGALEGVAGSGHAWSSNPNPSRSAARLTTSARAASPIRLATIVFQSSEFIGLPCPRGRSTLHRGPLKARYSAEGSLLG